MLWVSAVSAQMQAQTQAQAEPSPEGRTPLRLDFREHRGYRSWKRLLPTHVKVQYAGGMGSSPQATAGTTAANAAGRPT